MRSNINSYQLLVLSGGFGTRLKGSIPPNVPKTLASINNKTFLYYFLKNWYKYGIRNFIFLLHFQGKKIKKYLMNLKKKENLYDINFTFIFENEPLGTGGAVKNAIIKLDLKRYFLLTNSDTWLSDPSGLLLMDNWPSIGLVKDKGFDNRFGNIKFNKDKILSFDEKSKETNLNNTSYINAGVYCLDPNMFNQFDLYPASLEKDYFPKIIIEREIKPVILNTDFFDIGIPKDLKKFINWLENNYEY